MIKSDPAGNIISRWQVSEKVKFFASYKGIAFDSHNNIYVLNDREYRLEVFDSNGHFLKQISIGWPKWLMDNFPTITIIFTLFNLSLTIFELRYRRRHNLPSGSGNGGPVWATNTVGRASQIISLIASVVGLHLSFIMTAIFTAFSRTDSSFFHFSSPFVSISPEINASTVGWAVSFLFVVMLVSVFLVPKKPLAAGILQVAGGGLIFLVSLDPTLKILGIALLLGGALAIAGSTAKKEISRNN